MFNVTTKSIRWAGNLLTLETGKIARQADGCVLATLGETSVLAAVTYDKSPHETADFFPMTVHYQERYYASGKIPGGFFKREARPSETSTLTSRLIDRPIRPLFPEGFRYPVDVICTVLSHDNENNPDIVAMIAASAALTISGLPFEGPIGAARVGFRRGRYVLCPYMSSLNDLNDSPEERLDLVVAGTQEAVMMVESEAYELTEEEMLGAVSFGHSKMQPVISMIKELADEVGRPPFEFSVPDLSAVTGQAEEIGLDAMSEAYRISNKLERQDAIAKVYESIAEEIGGGDRNGASVAAAAKKLEAKVLRGQAITDGTRVDGRNLTTVRDIECEVGFLARTHGSALFTRGETQAMVVTTLGTGEDEQIVDALHRNFREPFLLHYNFPPYCVGETGRLGPPGRRETGHGKLAWRALRAVMPHSSQFPYTVRVVSEITESNGSSSMATVCGASLSLMDAAVPLKAPVAGVAMGLILEPDGSYAVLTDILGAEDHLGDMDFKVAGTRKGVTSLQMDIKVPGITVEIMSKALAQARGARLHILKEMAKVQSSVGEFSAHAPRIRSMKIPVDKIREVIGSGGKVIREIVEYSGAKIDIEDDGTIKVASPDSEALDKAFERISSIVAEPEVGKIYTGKVVRILDFGAFVNIMDKRDGLVHVSQICDRRLRHPSDVLKEGQTVKVKLTRIDDRGKMQLSMKRVDQRTGRPR
ncbi:MAG: polyribonucleotide nucleotidyltransferase [Rhodobacteraceae bacterium]|nr:polyribonucleotide nucleotidyltransferase [Paracoccaceae bacterium]